MEISENLGVFVLFGLTVGIFALYVLMEFAFNLVKRRSLKSQTPKPWWEGATMASHLAPRLLRYVRSKADLYIVERDATALTARDARRLRRFLKMTLQNGSVIHYILTSQKVADEQKLLQLKHELENGAKGTIDFCFVSTGKTEGKDDKELVKSLVTFHPVLVESENQRMMWIEGYHPPLNETLVYAWEFVPPTEAVKDDRYDKYKELLTRLIGKYGTGRELYA